MPPLNRVLGRLSPILVTMNKDHIPTFESTTISSPTSHYTERTWNEIVSRHSDSTVSSPSSTVMALSSSDVSSKPSENISHLVPLDSSTLQSKRLIIFGEQHHQSRVLAAQMKVLQLLHDSRRRHHHENNESHAETHSDTGIRNRDDSKEHNNVNHDLEDLPDPSSDSGQKFVSEHKQESNSSIILLLEPLNHKFNSHLQSWSSNKLSTSQLQHLYDTTSTEGFNFSHYLPLLELARSLSIPIYGGFPPREWARIVHREGIEALRRHEVYGEQVRESGFDDDENSRRWDGVRWISGEYEAYIRGMIGGGKPITFKLGSDHKDDNHGNSTRYEKGILPAQALKDSFFAWEIDRRLRRRPPPPPPPSSQDINTDHSTQTTILAICGLGHCEYGLGVCERITSCSRQEIFIIASKAWDQREYRGDQLHQQQFEENRDAEDIDHDKQEQTSRKGGRWLADCVVPYEPDP